MQLAISGAGSLYKNGSGVTTLTGANSYAGGTTVNAGTLAVGDGTTVGTLGGGPIVTNAALAINHSDVVVFAAGISSTGSVVQHGSGTTILTGAHSYSGATLINAGTLQ